MTRFSADRVLLTASGTQALQLALGFARSCARYSSGPVALPAYACFDVLTAAVGADVPIVFYDILPDSLIPDILGLRRALELGARCVVAANLYGFPLDWDCLRGLCHEFDALLVEDSAQGLGSEWGGLEGGSFGDLTVLSFGRGKGWTGGAGGALLMRGSKLGSEVVDSWVTRHPLSKPAFGANARALIGSAAQWALGRPWLYQIPLAIPGLELGVTEYKEPTRVTRIPAYAAAVVRRQADASSAAMDERRHWATIWRKTFERSGLNPCRPCPGGSSGYLRFPVIADSADSAEQLRTNGRAAGIERGYPKALFGLPQARMRIARQTNFPGSLILARRLLTFPTHPRVAKRDIRQVRKMIQRTNESRAY